MIDEAYKNVLIKKREVFRRATGTRKAIRIVMISASGVSKGGYYDTAQRILNADDMF